MGGGRGGAGTPQGQHLLRGPRCPGPSSCGAACTPAGKRFHLETGGTGHRNMRVGVRDPEARGKGSSGK